MTARHRTPKPQLPSRPAVPAAAPSRLRTVWRAVALALLAVALLPAAHGQQLEASGALRVLGFGLPDEIATERVALFEESYPDVDLQLTEGSIDQQQLLTAIASGNPPDVVYLNRADLSTYATRGAVQPLGQCLQDAGMDMGQFREAAVQEVTVDGEVYGVPDFYTVIVLVLNTAALEEAGVPVDEFSTSDWEQLAQWNQALTRNEDGLTRIGFDPKLPEFFPLWVRANGGQLLSDDGRTALLDSPEAVEALEFAAGLHEPAGGRAPFMAFRDTWDFFGAGNQMASDQFAAFPIEQWYVNVLSDVSPDAPIAVKAFTDRQGDPLTYATGSAWAIPTGAANPEVACAFVTTMSSPEAWERAGRARAQLRAEAGGTYTGTYTGNSVADEVIFGELVQPSGDAKFDDAVQVILSVQDAAFSIPANPAGAELRQAWTDAVNRVLNGEQSAQEALDQAQQEAQAALDAAWEE